MALARYTEADPGFALAWNGLENRFGRDGTADLRRRRFERFVAEGVPTAKVEAWKYTNIGKALNRAMRPASHRPIGVADVSPYLAGGTSARRLIFVNGHYVPELSHARGLPGGVRMLTFAEALRQEPERARASLENLQDGRGLTDLNAAFAEDGAWIEVAAGAAPPMPLQLIFLSAPDEAATMINPRVVVSLGDRAKLHLIESHVASAAGHVFTNQVTQIGLGAGAELTHDCLQLAKDGQAYLTKAEIDVAEAAVYRQTVLTLGGALQRNETEARLNGPKIDFHLNGAFMPVGAEHVDNVIRIHHVAPDCESNQFYKGVLDDKGRGVFAGKIIVHPDAQRTNAFQTNNNLLRSNDAEIDTKPELEIYADDVKCSHGATVGDLDPTALFYLRSRGMDKALAENVLTYAFVGEVIAFFADEAVRTAAKRAVFGRMAGGEALMEML